ncbi:MAG: metallophosphoesterase [Acidobacteria bacterium]|nr:metallophosphoesterase [Acidobacteriota bacterium]
MLRLAWVTDIHLNFLRKEQIKEFCNKLLKSNPEGLLITGDISEAPHLEKHLKLLARNLEIPIYFVLGNHDFYFGEIAQVRQEVTYLTNNTEFLKWVPVLEIVPLSKTTCLVGHDGWGDGRFGNYLNTPVFLNDFLLISDLISSNSQELIKKLNQLGDEAANYLAKVLPKALSEYKKVILITHVPPFKETCWHRGEISDENYLPFFSCKAVGEVLYKFMCEYTEKEMLVLCGHTHGVGQAQILPNLLVKTGGAIYGKPELQEIITVE